ncbi:MAG: 50S ribosomal protein L16 [Parcubacteria group bacterium GW2011_GWB1_45_7]|uniref:Large ribosomal subunit protein uL16 n=4 Tax=Parcubacteria group TaxID=1794811 RepID=A0A0H4TFZ1_9BACT|nr:50S ribosomal protein L16, large subunit ribosomal protein L16 [uncultured Parcubacteria bacterium Rifle_16ft_4_minimus_37647]AKQ05587.1 50S ribosomal protein L16, large subunit ribosomal protein L16 [uncultured Parcubacteria bacterium Rifle_16ft_4_minimus_23790]KKU11941.1 MAG: 50S ribosomal protein L16 [Parcubacteria group bacterium GW2011_GWB1_45_7]OGY58603.1 MAG: 50S ribosomal protein L16 [Candidatus Colwellbacteria bacterium RIFCSPHIGHO2_02_FULL_45_17]OGY61698.1 MAG: 50S ribosomal protei
MLMPKKVKHRKWHKGRSRKRLVETRGTTVAYGTYGIQALESAWLDSKQIEAGRRAITRALKREGMVWIRVFPDKPITKKAAEVGMGKGKGAVDHYAFPVRPGRVIFEVGGGITEEHARAALRSASFKMPFRTRIISKV